MRIAYYCQHVLGIGHFHRSLEICRHLAEAHEVTLILGGPDVPLEDHTVSVLQLPGLRMDEQFSALIPCRSGARLEDIKDSRRKELLAFISAWAPDCLMIELYPFGRKAFRFELDPLLAFVQQNLTHCRVYCSLRDILVEKVEGREKFEKRAVKTLNAYFSGLLIHSDKKLVSLEQTFDRVAELTVPLYYTGFITPKPNPAAAAQIRVSCGLAPAQKLIVASIGSGSVGSELLEAVAEAFSILPATQDWFCQLFTGPYCTDETFARLNERRSERFRVQRFTDQFINWLGAADVSVSMAGYNTCMNSMAAGVPALLFPFGQNREQRLRIEMLSDVGIIRLLKRSELTPPVLAGLIEHMAQKTHRAAAVDLDGVARTRSCLEAHYLEAHH